MKNNTDTHKPYILAISGYKNSGKTTLIDKLIPLFVQDNYKVASIKHDGHKFSPDVPGTDSAKHFAAGAYGSLVFDDEKYMLVQKISATLPSPETFFPDADIIFLEGFKYSSYPKIELGQRKGVDMNLSVSGICEEDTVICYVSDIFMPYHDGKTCFHYDDITQIYSFIQKHMKEFYETK